jgi:hydroxyacylglutathione hydrolase
MYPGRCRDSWIGTQDRQGARPARPVVSRYQADHRDAHTDHAGSAARLRALSGAPILAHEDDARFYSRETAMRFCPTGRAGRLLLRTKLPLQPYEGFEPDILMTNGETVNLLNFGVDGVVRHTGGHTAGSIAVER